MKEFLSKLFCKHDWDQVVKEVVPAPITNLHGSWGTMPSYMFQVKVIFILKCKKCGKLDKTVVVNP